MNILIIQTAFAGDLILTTPLMGELNRLYPEAALDVLCIPSTAGLLEHHPAIRETIAFNKRGGLVETLNTVKNVRERGYDVVVSPHRSLRSAKIALFSGAGKRITFDTSTGSSLYTDTVMYDGHIHEVERNLSLLEPLGLEANPAAPARLYPSHADEATVESELARRNVNRYICMAPGSVWATKRYTEEGFAQTASALALQQHVILIGGPEDKELCERIETAVGSERCFSLAGKLRWLETAALVGNAGVVISNDSAPVHVASAMGTPVVEIFGATVPEFGFTPWQVPHAVVQREGLACKPCAIHGGKDCPLGTLECMTELPAAWIIDAAEQLLNAG